MGNCIAIGCQPVRNSQLDVHAFISCETVTDEIACCSFPAQTAQRSDLPALLGRALDREAIRDVCFQEKSLPVRSRNAGPQVRLQAREKLIFDFTVTLLG